MSAAKKQKDQTWELTGPWAGAWKIFAGVGALGAAGAAAGAMSDPRRFAFSWLFAFVTCLTIALGAIFFVLIQRLTSAGWSVTVRRTAEFFAYGIVALLPLFIPILLFMGHLFPWLGHGDHGAAEKHGSISLIAPAYAQDHAAPSPTAGEKPPGTEHQPARPSSTPEEQGSPHARPAATAVHGPIEEGGHQTAAHAAHQAHEAAHAKIIAKKAPYLNKSFFLFRAAIYFIVWVFLAMRLFGYSTAQDTTKDPNLTLRAQAMAPPATFLFALSLTFAAFDWIMSLEPTWFSTIFGVVIFACGVVSSLAVIILTTMALRNSGPLSGAVTVEHYHDLGKLMFGFLVFWAYVQFSQLMLIWYAALPEETTFFHNRWDHDPWQKVSMAIIIGHFVVPFFWLISRNFKRNLGRLQIGAAILLVMHVVDMYWFVMPNYMLGKEGFAFSWIDAACLLAVGGIYGAFVFYRMTQFPLIPIGDPRLQRSLHFQNA
ncbi:MAG: hypothetical protein KF819_28495 [Labilithrix sp.]|nr:hypothetical protein [Labilithrix sp.]